MIYSVNPGRGYTKKEVTKRERPLLIPTATMYGG